jgi:ElaB/YqjD/DUF883 family membrane-anchored ribosome-binding protein
VTTPTYPELLSDDLEDLKQRGRQLRGKVADSLSDAARYLEGRDPNSPLVRLDSAIRAHPYRALAVGVGIGWIVGRLARRDG